MLPILISLPILGVLLMFQSAVASRIHLLSGATDLVLLALVAWSLHERVKSAWIWAIIGGILVGLESALPFGVMLAGYLATVGLVALLKHILWRTPLLIMFVATLAGTLLTNALSMLALTITGANLPFGEAFNVITLPSLLLNLLMALPVYAIMTDFASWLYPEETEV